MSDDDRDIDVESDVSCNAVAVLFRFGVSCSLSEILMFIFAGG